jgi:uncharacterized protein (TIGR02266 family)
MTFQNRRGAPRIPVSLTVQFGSGGEFQRAVIINRSPGGVFIRTSKPLPIGTAIELVIKIAGEQPIRQRGKVVWERLLGKGAPPHEPEGMGVQFEEPIDPRLK